MTPLHIVKLQSFIHSVETADLIQCVARRYNTGYARMDSGREWTADMAHYFATDVRNKMRWNLQKQLTIVKSTDFGKLAAQVVDSRYGALNWQNPATVEYRIFRGSTRYVTIMACLEFAFATWHFTRLAAVSDLTVEAFMKFICSPENRKDTKHLREYLMERKFVKFYQYEQVFRPKDKRVAIIPGIEDQRLACACSDDD